MQSPIRRYRPERIYDNMGGWTESVTDYSNYEEYWATLRVHSNEMSILIHAEEDIEINDLVVVVP